MTMQHVAPNGVATQNVVSVVVAGIQIFAHTEQTLTETPLDWTPGLPPGVDSRVAPNSPAPSAPVDAPISSGDAEGVGALSESFSPQSEMRVAHA